MLIGTAGHIDHGKTSLIKRLTGRNTDRLPEEIKRGISIELGYAYVPVLSGVEGPVLSGDEGATAADVLGFIDVPGHEKFVHTMVAGATGIDFALLVVAADDGVMPQTEEHVDILRLLGLDDGAIALTKVDAVDAHRVTEVQAQLARWLAGSGQADWPVFPLSSVTGAGVTALDQFIRTRAAQHRARSPTGQFRLAVDRVFTLAGIGTIVTGTAHDGVVRVGEEVLLQPRGLRARVRSVHAQDRPAESGLAGQRCALNLAGIARDDVSRGDWVQGAALVNLSARFDATLRLSVREAMAFKPRSGVHLHQGTRDVLARVAVLDAERVEPGAEQLVSVCLDAPLPVCKGDRFVIRDASARRTLGGGRVLDIAPPNRGRRKPERLALLRALRDDAPRDALAACLAAAPVVIERLSGGWNLPAPDVASLLEAVDARVSAGTAFSSAYWNGLRRAVLNAVAATHEREPEMPGLEQNRLRRMVAPGLAADALADLIDELLRESELVRRGAFLAQPAHKAELGKDERVRWERIKPLLMSERFDPPRVRDIARVTSIPESEVRSLMKRVARVGEVTLIAHDHFFLTDTVREMADIAGALMAGHGKARAAQFRDCIGTGRKIAIQVLEFFDRVGYTRRVRDDHVARRDNPWRVSAIP
jgi:selenocysteine-specific elongation factor